MLPRACVRLFFRYKRLSLTYLAALLLTAGFLVNQLRWISTAGLAELLSTCQDVGIIAFLALAFLSYEFLHLAQGEALEEAACQYRQYSRFQLFQLLLLFLLAAVVAAVHWLICLMICWMESCLRPAVLLHLAQASFLNIFLVAVVGLLFGAVLSRRCSPILAYGLIFFVTFLQTPYAEVIFYIPTGLTGVNFYSVKDLISLVAPNTHAILDRVYGLSLEAYRWDVALFWTLLLAALFFYSVTRNTWKRAACRSVSALLTVGAVCFFWSFAQSGQDSVQIRDERTSVVTIYGYEYYTGYNSDEGAPELRQQEAGFQVTAYDLDLTANRKLVAQAQLTLSGEPEDGRYYFTLYHGYTVSQVTDGAGNPLSFTQEADYLDVYTDTALDTLVISYSGTGHQYYSNAQAIALPGYFPYYPMAGYYTIWDTWEEQMEDGSYSTYYGAVVNTDQPEAAFTVTVHSGLEVVSNLEESEPNVFSGTAQTVTLLGGLIETAESGGITYVNPIFGSSDITWSQPSFSEIKELLQTYRSLLGQSETLPEDFKILLIPDTIRYFDTSATERFVYYEDHILTTSYSSEQICNYLEERIAAISGTEEGE